MLGDTKTFSSFAARDLDAEKQFDQDDRGIASDPHGGMPRVAWFSDPAGNVLSVVEDGPSS
ncbi:MAG: hypothetical protein WBA45_01805 [Microthrixaceae bacterium]